MATADESIEFLSADLAPGDAKAVQLDCRSFEVERICSNDQPMFTLAYERLWAAFGSHDTMESREIIMRRLAWHPVTTIGNFSLRYEMILVRRQEQFVAVRDHTAVISRQRGAPHVVVHLSHVLVDPGWRRTGIAAWLRAWPLQTARACLEAAGLSTAPVTLVAEMEHPELQFPERMGRLQAYEKAGFQKVDPSVVKYFQPDFRAPEKIDAGGGPQPLPFALILRRVGREQERIILGLEVREIVECLYTVYGAGFRPRDMAVVWEGLQGYPRDESEIALLRPTQ